MSGSNYDAGRTPLTTGTGYLGNLPEFKPSTATQEPRRGSITGMGLQATQNTEVPGEIPPKGNSVISRAWQGLSEGFTRLRENSCNPFKAIAKWGSNISNPFKSQSVSKQDKNDIVGAGQDRVKVIKTLLKSPEGRTIFGQMCVERHATDNATFIETYNKFSKAKKPEERQMLFGEIQDLLRVGEKNISVNMNRDVKEARPRVDDVPLSNIARDKNLQLETYRGQLLASFDFSNDAEFNSKLEELTVVNEKVIYELGQDMKSNISELQKEYNTKPENVSKSTKVESQAPKTEKLDVEIDAESLKVALDPNNFQKSAVVNILLKSEKGQMELRKICDKQGNMDTFNFLMAVQKLKTAPDKIQRFLLTKTVQQLIKNDDNNDFFLDLFSGNADKAKQFKENLTDTFVSRGITDDDASFKLLLDDYEKIAAQHIVSLNLNSSSQEVENLRKLE